MTGLLSAPATINPCSPMNAFPSPNISAQPIRKKAIDEMPKTTKFFARMLTAFFARQNPASRQPNPAFMKNTRIPAIKGDVPLIVEN